MFKHIFYLMLLLSPALSRYMPRFSELEEEDQMLVRAAYDTPSYDHGEYQEDDDMSLGKLDLLKDGLWAIKAKLKELKAFDKALLANLLSTKLKVKDLLAPLKKHHHADTDKKKPMYNYQAPSYPQYEHQYAAAAPAVVPQYPQYPHDPYYGL